MKRVTFLYPSTNIPVTGVFDPAEESLRLTVSYEDLAEVDRPTANKVVEFCKFQHIAALTWEEARRHLISLGVDPSSLEA